MLSGLIEMPWWGYVTFTLIVTHITCVAVTVFLHRHQAHQSLELHPISSHFFRFWLWLTTGMVTKEWTAVHRKHHAVVETEDDPHSPKIHGIWKVVFGGVPLYQKEASKPETLKTFGRGTPDDWLERTLYTPRHVWGVVLMAIIDLVLFGIWPGALIWIIQMIWIPFWAAGIVNGVGHHVGYRNFATKDASTNISPWGIIIAGEELHNNHHAYASSARLSNKWYEFDIGWMWIRLMEMVGLAKVRRVAPKVRFDLSKTACDPETLRAIVLHRLHVMTNYKKALKQAYSAELARIADSSQLSSLKNIKKALFDLENSDEGETKEKIAAVLANYPMLQKAYDMRKGLVAFWDSATGTQEQLVDRLNEWCKQAEQSGIEALKTFSAKLRTYALASA